MWLPSLVTTLLAVALGYYLSLDPAWLHLGFEPSPTSYFLGLLAGCLGLVAILKWPETGLLILVAVIYTNGSEIAVRYHHWPSLLHLMAPLLVIGILGRQLMSSGRKLVADWMIVLLVLYSAVIFSSSLMAADPTLADEKLLEHLKNLFIFLAIINLTTSRLALRRAVWVLVLVGAFLGTVSVYQVFTSSYGLEFGGFGRIKLAQIVEDVRQPRIAGPLSDPNFYAQILVPLVPLALYRLWDESSPRLKLIAAYALGVTLLALLFTYSRGGALALAMVLMLAAIHKKAKWQYFFLALIIITPLLLFIPQEFEGRLGTLNQLISGEAESTVHPDTSFRQRTLLMRTAWEMFSDHPIIGVGAGNYSEHYQEYSQHVGSTVSSYENFDQRRFPHSLYLEIAAETGLLGLTIFALIVGACLSSARSAVRRFEKTGDLPSANLVTSLALGFVGYLASSMFLHGHYIRYFWLLIALMVAAKHTARQPNGSETQKLSISRI